MGPARVADAARRYTGGRGAGQYVLLFRRVDQDDDSRGALAEELEVLVQLDARADATGLEAAFRQGDGDSALRAVVRRAQQAGRGRVHDHLYQSGLARRVERGGVATHEPVHGLQV